MSESQSRQAFLDTILSEPDVESHRLIFADWLEEHGDLHKAEGLRTLPGLAGVWSSDWGEDEHGLWCVFVITTLLTISSRSVTQKMRWIEPGTFWMGSSEREHILSGFESPHHEVELTRGFWLADTPCTQQLWETVMGENPCERKVASRPVENVTLAACESFLGRVSELVRGLNLELPTEAQWEYACRAGTEGNRYHDDLDAIAWHRENCGGRPQPVGKKLPNAWGLYDTLGNVWEWCRDGRRKYSDEKVIDPLGSVEADQRIIRGGGWLNGEEDLRAPYRPDFNIDGSNRDLGFRFSCSE